jgi:hypothetical protein
MQKGKILYSVETWSEKDNKLVYFYISSDAPCNFGKQLEWLDIQGYKWSKIVRLGDDFNNSGGVFFKES